MAHEASIIAVVCERHAASGALVGVAALAAAYKLIGSAAVYKQNTLLSSGDVLLQLFSEPGTDVSAVSSAKLPLHIHNLHFREHHIIISVFKLKVGILSALSLIHADYVRRGRAKKQQSPCFSTAKLGNITGIIAWTVLRLVGLFLLLVNYNYTQVFRRGEHSTSGAYSQSGLSGLNTFPLIIAFPKREAAVEHSHIIPKVGGKSLYHLRGQRNLRNQKYGTPATAQLFHNKMNIYTGFSTAGNTKKQSGPAFPGTGKSIDTFKYLFLFTI